MASQDAGFYTRGKQAGGANVRIAGLKKESNCGNK